MTALATIDGFDAAGVTVHVPWTGLWVLSGTIADEAFTFSERQVTCKIGVQTFVGTIDVQRSGEFLLQKRVHIIGGAAGWRKQVAQQSFHNDAGVKRQTVAKALAKATGETLGDELTGTLGIDYCWFNGTAANPVLASATIEQIAPDWHVGFDGKTYLNPWSSVAADDTIEALDYDKNANSVSLGIYETIPRPGMTITDERFGTVSIRSVFVSAQADRVFAVAWFGASGRTRLANAVESIAKRSNPGLFGIYRYRVVSMNSDNRVNLQAVKSGIGLPDLLTVTQTPGMPGFKNTLTQSAIVLVQFIDGDPSLPRITNYHDVTDGAFVPQTVQFANGTKPAAGIGDQIMVFLGVGSTFYFNGVIDGATATGTMTVVAVSPTYGVITTGNPKLTI